MVTKAELINRIAKKEACSASEAKRRLELTVDIIKDALRNGESVRLSGLGTFEPRTHAEREGYNPQNGDRILIPKYNTVSFRISRDFKSILN